jgi:signal transduction histidine kinase
MMSVNGTIHQHSFEGLLPFPLYNNPEYLATFFVFLGLALYMSIYLANSIARELYQRERSLTQAKEQIENAEKTKSQYVMSVVHDLKTPIVAAMTHLDLILGGLLGPIADEQLNSLERIKVRLNGAVKTINDILYISQLKLESAIEKVEDVNIVNVLDEIYKDHRVIMKSKEIKYKLDFEQDGEYLIEAEPRLLKLALANIISNACKYTENGGKVEVQLKKIKNILLLSIADTGIGIAENEHDKIFTEFYRASGAKKKGIEGTGLGLSIVKQTVERYHGSIIVESPSKLSDDPAKPGTRFVITLPRHYSLSKDGIKLSS